MATSSATATATKGPKLKVVPFNPHGDWLDLGKQWEKCWETQIIPSYSFNKVGFFFKL
jgi:hypothetical protein